MIYINPKIIRDICMNLNVNYFDMCGDDFSGGKGSPYQIIVNDNGSVSIQIQNRSRETIVMIFDGSKYVKITSSNGKYKVFTLSRRNEGYFELEHILHTIFNVNI